MMKSIKIIILVLLVTSCNSVKKKETAAVHNKDTAQLDTSIKRGELVYNNLCIMCHMPNGKGVPKVFPPLAGSDYLKDNQTKSIKGIKNGMSGEIEVNGTIYSGVMAPLGLSDEEIADVSNYINNSWGNDIENFITPDKVSEL
jgi:mono/diheme cytochrome c family protein